MKPHSFMEMLKRPLGETYRNNSVTATILGVLIFLIIFFIRPFGISDDDTLYLFITATTFGLSSGLIFYLNTLIIKLQKTQRTFSALWHVSFLLFITLQTALIDALLATLLLKMMPLNWGTCARLICYVYILHIPIILLYSTLLIVLANQKEITVLQTKNEYLKDILSYKESSSENSETLHITVDDAPFEFERKRLISISSCGNYLKFLMQTDAQPIEIVKRDSLKSIESQLINHAEFRRCHRSHMVNTSFIKSINGTLKKAEAILTVDADSIPIARSAIKEMQNILAQRDNS